MENPFKKYFRPNRLLFRLTLLFSTGSYTLREYHRFFYRGDYVSFIKI